MNHDKINSPAITCSQALRIFCLSVPCIILCLWAALSSAHGQPEKLIVAIDHWPPWTIVENGEIGGIDVLIAKELAERLHMEIGFIHCPFRRCLSMLEEGRADLKTTLFKRPEREEYAVFIEPPYLVKSGKCFYVRRDAPEINTYEDLYGLKAIGVLRGSVYFEPFDNDTKLKKFPVTNVIQLLDMLDHNRLDAIIGTDTNIDYLIIKNKFDGHFRKTAYQVDIKQGTYMALSKKSKHIQRLQSFNDTIRQMVQENRIEEIIDAYFINLKIEKPK